jgi:hypothetical protein
LEIQSGVVFLLLQALEVVAAAAAAGSPFLGIIIWSFLEEDLGVGYLRDHRSKEEETSKPNKGSKQARGVWFSAVCFPRKVVEWVPGT